MTLGCEGKNEKTFFCVE